MQIAFYAPLKPPGHPTASGDRTVARGLMAALERAGHVVTVASTFRSFDRGDRARQARLREVGRRLADRLARRLGRGPARPDLWFTYHLYHKAPDWLGPEVADHLGIPYVVAEASYAPKQAGGAWELGHRAAADAIRRADRVVQLNPADAECVLPLLASPDRLVRISPFIDTAPFRATPREAARERIAARFGPHPALPWLVTVAMMRADQKLSSYRVLARALAQVTGDPWHALLAGAGPAEPEVRDAFAPLEGRITWIGMLDRVSLADLYRAGDLYLWPAVKEAWGMTLIEAQAAGLPVVAGRSGGVAAVVADGRTGLLTPEGDADAFAAAVRRLLGDPGLRTRMSGAAEDRAAREHDIAAAADRLDTMLRGLLHSRAA